MKQDLRNGSKGSCLTGIYPTHMDFQRKCSPCWFCAQTSEQPAVDEPQVKSHLNQHHILKATEGCHFAALSGPDEALCLASCVALLLVCQETPVQSLPCPVVCPHGMLVKRLLASAIAKRVGTSYSKTLGKLWSCSDLPHLCHTCMYRSTSEWTSQNPCCIYW